MSMPIHYSIQSKEAKRDGFLYIGMISHMYILRFIPEDEMCRRSRGRRSCWLVAGIHNAMTGTG